VAVLRHAVRAIPMECHTSLLRRFEAGGRGHHQRRKQDIAFEPVGMQPVQVALPSLC